MLFNEDGKKIIETSNSHSIDISPRLQKTDINHVIVKNEQNNDYLVITRHIDMPNFKGYSV